MSHAYEALLPPSQNHILIAKSPPLRQFMLKAVGTESPRVDVVAGTRWKTPLSVDNPFPLKICQRRLSWQTPGTIAMPIPGTKHHAAGLSESYDG